MANQEHLNVLKQGVKIWNRWREENPNVKPDLDDVNLAQANLNGIDFSDMALTFSHLQGASLIKANLMGTDLEGSELANANLSYANLMNTILRIGCENATFYEANLSNAQCQMAIFSQANFTSAILTETNFIETRLDNANFDSAQLTLTYFNGSLLDGADFTDAFFNQAAFCNVDLSRVKGLDRASHYGPSSISADTLLISRGAIPVDFLEAAGVPDALVQYSQSLINKALDFYSCFISYSKNDQAFAERLYTDLRSKGVRCWFAPKDLKIGDHYHRRIDESIRLYDKFILILSEQAVQSSWVEREVVAAREKEDRQQREVLFPLRLDDSVMNTTKAWAADVRRRWHIDDFTQWKDHDAYQQSFERLLRDLKAQE